MFLFDWIHLYIFRLADGDYSLWVKGVFFEGIVICAIYRETFNIGISSSCMSMISPAPFTIINVPFPGMQIFSSAVKMPVPITFLVVKSILTAMIIPSLLYLFFVKRYPLIAFMS